VTHNVAEGTVVLKRPTAWKSGVALEYLSVQYVRLVIQRVLLQMARSAIARVGMASDGPRVPKAWRP
jgi:hypothetical protein